MFGLAEPNEGLLLAENASSTWISRCGYCGTFHADPNFTLSQQNLGFHSKGNFEALADKIKEWSEMPEASARIGMRGRDYVEKNHHAELIQAQLINMFQSFG